MKDKTRYLLFAVWAVLAIGFFALPLLLSSIGVTGTAPMLAMPVVVARDGALVRTKDVRSFQYQFAEVETSFEPRASVEGMKDARVYGDWFLVEAPFTRMTAMFGRTTTSPRYRSLRLRLVFFDGTKLSLSLPVISDTALNRPIRIDLDSEEAGKSPR